MLTDQHIHESNLIEGYDNADFDRQSWIAWSFLKGQKELTLDIICKIQKMITLIQDDLMPNERGYTRSMSKINVIVGHNTPPSWFMVDDLLRNWVLDIEEHGETLTPKEMHIRFEHVHPFVDGNGRTGRMLMWWQEIKQGKEPTLILDSEKQDYYKWF